MHNLEQTRQALAILDHAGYSEDEIGFLVHASTIWPEDDVLLSAATEAVESGMLRGVFGTTTALFISGFGLAIAGSVLLTTLGAGIGALAGSLIGTLVTIGVPEEEARSYRRELEKGRTIITVKVTSGYDEALAILRDHGASEARIHVGEWNAVLSLRYAIPQSSSEVCPAKFQMRWKSVQVPATVVARSPQRTSADCCSDMSFLFFPEVRRASRCLVLFPASHKRRAARKRFFSVRLLGRQDASIQGGSGS